MEQDLIAIMSKMDDQIVALQDRVRELERLARDHGWFGASYTPANPN